MGLWGSLRSQRQPSPREQTVRAMICYVISFWLTPVYSLRHLKRVDPALHPAYFSRGSSPVCPAVSGASFRWGLQKQTHSGHVPWCGFFGGPQTPQGTATVHTCSFKLAKYDTDRSIPPRKNAQLLPPHLHMQHQHVSFKPPKPRACRAKGAGSIAGSYAAQGASARTETRASQCSSNRSGATGDRLSTGK